MDKKSTFELIVYMLHSIDLIEERFMHINTSDDFLADHNGLEKLDAISMRLQTIGESIKNILKRNNNFLEQFAEKNYWSDIVRFRDILSHHYIDIDAEIVFDICHEYLPELKSLLTIAQKELERSK